MVYVFEIERFGLITYMYSKTCLNRYTSGEKFFVIIDSEKNQRKLSNGLETQLIKKEAHGPHCSPEKTIQIIKHIWLYHNVD